MESFGKYEIVTQIGDILGNVAKDIMKENQEVYREWMEDARNRAVNKANELLGDVEEEERKEIEKYIGITCEALTSCFFIPGVVYQEAINNALKVLVDSDDSEFLEKYPVIKNSREIDKRIIEITTRMVEDGLDIKKSYFSAIKVFFPKKEQFLAYNKSLLNASIEVQRNQLYDQLLVEGYEEIKPVMQEIWEGFMECIKDYGEKYINKLAELVYGGLGF